MSTVYYWRCSTWDMHGDPIAASAEDGDDEVDVETIAAAHIGPSPPSLHGMMETIMTTQQPMDSFYMVFLLRL